MEERFMDEAQRGGVNSQNQGAVDQQGSAPPQALDLVTAAQSDVGRARPHNEDWVQYYVPPDPQQLAQKGAIYLVADGMGGHQAGEVASRGAAEAVIAQYYSDVTHDVATSLVRAYHAANQLIHTQAQEDPSRSGMGTTMVAAVILGRRVYVANVGDSRAYLINHRGINQITEDHSWVEEQVRAGMLTAEQARRHPQRNLVTRALGSKPSVEVDLFEGEIGAGDTLLLCSDGLTGRVQDQEIAAIVRGNSPQEATRRLVALANERGGNDNITVLLVSAQVEAAAATMKTAVVAPPVQKAPEKSRLIPVLAGVGVFAVLVLVGLLVVYLLSGNTPDANSTESPLVPTATVLTDPTSLPAGEASAAPSETPSPVILTDTPLPAATAALAGPTATLAPTSTATPRPTATHTPASTNTSRPAATTAPQSTLSLNVTFTVQPLPTGSLPLPPPATP
jgi:serine/threonine protein phosphatase PrpC